MNRIEFVITKLNTPDVDIHRRINNYLIELKRINKKQHIKKFQEKRKFILNEISLLNHILNERISNFSS